MKKILLIIATLCFMPPVMADIPLPAVSDIQNYTVIKTTSNYTPLRDGASTNAKRFSHLKKGTQIFADKSVEDFYRVDLGLDKHYWIEKKYAQEEAQTAIKTTQIINNIKFYDNDKYYIAEIKTPVLPPYNEIETTEKSLDFILYDTVLDKENLNIKGNSSADFEILKDEFNNLKISYSSDVPLTGHDVEKTDTGLLLKVKKPFKYTKSKTLSRYTFAIDPGHGGADSGACANGLKEKDLNFEISKILAKDLEKEGAKVYLTREDDTNPDLYDRIDFAKDKKADFLISIHQNSLANPKNVDKKHGVGVYYYNKESYPLAQSVQNELKKGTDFQDDGVNLASLALVRSTDPVCILVECGYIIHQEEAKKLSEPKFQKVVAKSIINGVKNYLSKNF